jgi:hypothetical protein
MHTEFKTAKKEQELDAKNQFKKLQDSVKAVWFVVWARRTVYWADCDRTPIT